ncbi:MULTISPECIES: alpha/beta fold hydrolase [Streptomyces]|uniref:Pimeloyl-ACP methyl ester carboxylesterase n=1 Tax=Streptomyces demainii TaxID=588122 RepID=A0ABT9KZ69_9ACTN|nr:MULTISPECIES: alpha/beta hydrolase [Streptomyces]MBW8088744.1 alpha/beta hydrolase [Streptomyces hygroscopicus subsp. hygroscopicus]MCO8302855.1 alpha/beta hydrolase [Streptomyces sp. RKCA744]MDP9613735.1 pimeloyl-ACP methyl ester carboxylesterase [Streptomyces demainii]
MTGTEWNLDRTHRSSSGEVRWAALGAPDAPPVVLLHGTPFSSYVWRGPARALAGRHRVFVWDMPGYGASEKRAGQDVSLAAQGRVFGELLDAWGLTGQGAEPAVVAHDFGGCVALRAHLLHGARFRRLALVDAVALAPWGSPAYRLLGGHAEVFERLPQGLHRALVREYVGSASAVGLPDGVLERLVEPWCGAEGQPAFYRQIARNDQRFTDEIEGRYGEIALPTLICWGADDSWIPVERGRELAARIPGARLRLIEGAGHLVQEDAPAELGVALSEFLG